MNNINPNDPHIGPLPISHETGDALAKPIATSIGEASKTLLDGVFHLAFDPIRKFNIQREAYLERFKIEVQTSVQTIPEKYQDDSKIGLVLKSIEDSKYQLNSDELRAMFTRLITVTLDSRANSSISPKFSAIISEMSPREARLLEMIYYNTASLVPFVRLKAENKSTYSSKKLGNGFLLLDDHSENSMSLELSLLESANLITFHEDTRLIHSHFADIFTEFRSFFPEDLNTFLPDISDEEELVFEHSYYSLTELGESFCKIVFKSM